MEVCCCDLEVDVNGEETFFVQKEKLTSYSGKLSKLFRKPLTSNIKVIFHEFPGGAKSFELICRFCYNGGRTEITPKNIALLHCAAYFMEMRSHVSGIDNLYEMTEKSLDELKYWTCDELLHLLKQLQDFLATASSSGLIEKCLDSLVGRLASIGELSSCPSSSSPESSGIRFSCDSRSTESLKNSFSRANWWFDELLVLNTSMIEMVTRTMVCRKLDHSTVSRFLIYYQKTKFSGASADERCKVLEAIINMLFTLEWTSISCKSLFGILQGSQHLRINKSCREKLEIMIGSQLYHATLDNLLIPCPSGASQLYDVNLIIRLLKVFLSGGFCQVSAMRIKKVAKLMDLYIAEVAPDPLLKPRKFHALVMALPDSARDSNDAIYRAVDMYLEVHPGLSEEDRQKICCGLNCEKLSSEVCIQLSHNAKFPQITAVQALKSQQLKLKCLIQNTDKTRVNTSSPSRFGNVRDRGEKDEANQQIVLYAGTLDHPTDNEILRAHLQGMQSRVMELEKVCKRMQSQMEKVRKAKASSRRNTRSLPKLCS